MQSDQARLVESDEIDLFELVEGIWRQKLLVFLIAALVTAGACAYVLLATPVYEAKVFVQPPSQNDIAQLKYGRGGGSGLSSFSVKDVYGVYLRHLQSESLRREFFRTYYLPSLSEKKRHDSQDALYNKFKETLTVGPASKQAPDRFVVIANNPDSQSAAQWVVRYLEMAGERAKREVIKDARADALVRADNLEQQITAARESARKQREDELVQLNEALKVAESVGLEKPPIISNSLSSEVSAGMDGSLVYMRGAKALEAEIENLRARQSDDPFINDLRQRQESISFYRSLRVDPAVIAVYRQDGAIESPDRPVRPNRVLVVTMSVLLGVVLGGIVAVMRDIRAGRWRRGRVMAT
ncbi:LPS O-antigen chain length determinant protein WzzB [Pseudomonas faucium]|uniref:LPS O-antigen chain length determinant protein WzzB n=1 Tax=Pseudomonas faucium TaxID=2740518 RepID=UPI001596DFC0|nr:Wzz/FepE/Etk N-terminal domain-containing protein [Pseudomonas faucium]